ncbi:MAG: hypothetical protein ABIS92_09610 [Polyangia bacterium]
MVLSLLAALAMSSLASYSIGCDGTTPGRTNTGGTVGSGGAVGAGGTIGSGGTISIGPRTCDPATPAGGATGSGGGWQLGSGGATPGGISGADTGASDCPIVNDPLINNPGNGHTVSVLLARVVSRAKFYFGSPATVSWTATDRLCEPTGTLSNTTGFAVNLTCAQAGPVWLTAHVGLEGTSCDTSETWIFQCQE